MRNLSVALFGLVLAGVLNGCGPSADEIRTQAISQYQIGHYDEAENLFEQVRQRRPMDPDSWYYLGKIAQEKNWYARAIHCYEQAIAADPSFKAPKAQLELIKKKIGDKRYDELRTNPDIDKTTP